MVALLAEGVDRNVFKDCWDEAVMVALLAEGVDRNPNLKDKELMEYCRPPRGGRG